MTTTKKTCFKCGQSKSRNEFYRHSEMEDGLLGKCIDCTKADVAINRAKNLSRIQEYDRRRGSRPDRRKRNAERASKYLADRTRAKADTEDRAYYSPSITIGTLIGYAILSVMPIANLFSAIFDVAPKLFSSLIEWCEKALNIPLVPKRKSGI